VYALNIYKYIGLRQSFLYKLASDVNQYISEQKLKYIYQAFLNGEIMVKDAWTTEDIQNIEQLRQNKSVPVKVALYHLKQFLSNKYALKRWIWMN
jgi:hypothetical protein